MINPYQLRYFCNRKHSSNEPWLPKIKPTCCTSRVCLPNTDHMTVLWHRRRKCSIRHLQAALHHKCVLVLILTTENHLKMLDIHAFTISMPPSCHLFILLKLMTSSMFSVSRLGTKASVQYICFYRCSCWVDLQSYVRNSPGKRLHSQGTFTTEHSRSIGSSSPHPSLNIWRKYSCSLLKI